jgi:heme-degrading monooxygenase HmoA
VAVVAFAREAAAIPAGEQMFARVITAQAGAEGFDTVVRLAREQVPGAGQQPGFKGFYLLTDAETGKMITISLWETREEMEAVAELAANSSGIHHVPAAGIASPRLETYEVTVHV